MNTKLFESIIEKKEYLSNCVNSFDADTGNWKYNLKPVIFRNATEFAQEWEDEEKIKEITKDDFYNNIDEITIPKKL